MNEISMNVYEEIKKFKRKFPMTVAWRLKKHSKVIQKFINPGEKLLYVFTGQKNFNPLNVTSTYILALTSKRIILAQKRLLFGFYYTTITPDMFNDLQVKQGIIWGKIIIDTVKEEVVISNIDKNALDDIETNISEYMMREKRKYVRPE